MQISWNGLGCFTLVAKSGQGEVTVVTNPFKPQDDMKIKGGVASVIVQSHEGKDTENVSAFEAEHPEESKKVFLVSHAGEYEVQGVFVIGVDAPKKDDTPHTLYRIDAEGMRVGFLGAIDRSLTAKEVDALGTIDVLILPAGGNGVLSPQDAASVIGEIEPRLVIPSYVGSGSYASVEVAKREIGCPADDMPKLKITRAQLPEEDMRMTVLQM
jgi:L-ascorbate metabolism protein UlaG (beta-lactamase superfamily)